jgi:hypothetical protein
MVYLFRKLRNFYNGRSFPIFVISFLVYAVINMIENYIHYNIGRHKESDYHIEFSWPTTLEWTKIAVVMVVFATLQGILTILIEQYWNKK